MNNSGKIKLKGKQIASDIRAGMDPHGIKRKYGLSDKVLASVCRKLLDAGLLSKQEMHHFVAESLASSGPPPLSPEPSQSHWQCPACQAVQSSEVSECPRCGVIVAKYTARQVAANDVPMMTYTPGLAGEAIGANKWAYVIVSIVVLALIGVTIVVWSTRRSNPEAKILTLSETKHNPAEEISQETDSSEPISPEDQNSSPVDSPIESENPETTKIDPRQLQTQPELPRVTTRPSPVSIYPGSDEPIQGDTGDLRRFTSRDFKKEVVEASKTVPVIFQFYSDT
jgi:hypothetical protein